LPFFFFFWSKVCIWEIACIVFLWLIWLNMMIFRPIHFIANDIISFFFLSESYYIMHIYQIFYIH
jgi:hypothetical protein